MVQRSGPKIANIPCISLISGNFSRGRMSADCGHHQSITSNPETSALLPEVVDASAARRTIVHRVAVHLVSDQRTVNRLVDERAAQPSLAVQAMLNCPLEVETKTAGSLPERRTSYRSLCLSGAGCKVCWIRIEVQKSSSLSTS